MIYYHQPLLSWEALACLFAGYFLSPVADIDKRGSVAGQQAAPVSMGLSWLHIRHRTVTHSFLVIGLLYSILQLCHIPDVLMWSALFAYASHPLLDLLNIEGVELMWPIRFRFKLLPGILAIPVNSPSESILRGALLLVSTILTSAMVFSTIKGWPYIGPIVTGIAHKLPPALLKLLLDV